MTRNYNSLDRFLRKLLRRSILNEEEQQAVLSLPMRAEQVPPHVDFVEAGQMVDHSCMIVQGLGGRFGHGREGNRQVTALYIPGDMADLHSLVSPRATAALQALTTTTIIKIPHQALREITSAYPAIAEAFWRECVIDAGIMSEWVVNLGRRGAGPRLAHLYCEMACRYRLGDMNEQFPFEFPVTQHDLADMLGLTSVHVNRTLRVLEAEGLIRQKRGRVEIISWSRLAEFADFSPAYLHLRHEPRAPMRAVPGHERNGLKTRSAQPPA